MPWPRKRKKIPLVAQTKKREAQEGENGGELKTNTPVTVCISAESVAAPRDSPPTRHRDGKREAA